MFVQWLLLSVVLICKYVLRYPVVACAAGCFCVIYGWIDSHVVCISNRHGVKIKFHMCCWVFPAWTLLTGSCVLCFCKCSFQIIVTFFQVTILMAALLRNRWLIDTEKSERACHFTKRRKSEVIYSSAFYHSLDTSNGKYSMWITALHFFFLYSVCCVDIHPTKDESSCAKNQKEPRRGVQMVHIFSDNSNIRKVCIER